MTPYQLAGKRVWVAGHTGMTGSALTKRLARESCTLLTATHSQLDLMRQSEVEAWMAENKPDVVILAAATVGGIMANSTRPAEFLYNNLMIETNVIHSAWVTGVEKLLFLGSSCIYPRLTPQPMCEESLLTGVPEPTNEGYALAKIAGIKMCEYYRRQYGCDFIASVPTNLYGPNDNFDQQSSHVIPGMMVRAFKAKQEQQPTLTIWGTGAARREFLHVDEAADACVYLLKNYSSADPVNVGTGVDISIAELAALIVDVVGYQGRIEFDTTKPDGMPIKRLDVSRLQTLGWQAGIPLRDGLIETYEWFLSQPHLHEA